MVSKKRVVDDQQWWKLENVKSVDNVDDEFCG